MMGPRSREAAQRFADRRKREDDAPRLSVEIPALASLRLLVEERRGSITTAESKHVRHVMVDRAPALFVIPCGDPSCEAGGYDLTTPIMSALRAKRAEFSVEDECMGSVGGSGGRCGRVLTATGTATYKA
jgi:hypothetical protein